MSTILVLALDPFCEIISLLDLDDILAIWITGNFPLQSKLLKSNAVRDVRVLPRKSSNAPWPPVVQYFNDLTSFKLYRPQFVMTPAVLAQNLLTLGRKLTSLMVTAQFAISAFNELMASNPDHFPNLTSLDLVSTSESAALNVPLPRTVTKLILGDDYQFMSSLSLCYLPPSLISLKCDVDSLLFASSPSMFPPGLESLELQLPSCRPMFHLIPISCTSITLYIIHDGTFKMTRDDWRAISRLPLKLLRMPISSPIGIEEVQMLPKTLETLWLRVYSVLDPEEWLLSILPFLPPNLKELEEGWPEITVELAQAMPRTLEMSFDCVYPEAVAYLPPKTVKIALVEEPELSLISAFPPFLQEVMLPELTPEVSMLLPHTLKAFCLRSDRNGYTEATIKLLPPHLTSVSLELLDRSHSFQSFDHIQSLEALPKTLTDLSLTTDLSRQNTENIVRHLTPSQSSQSLPHQLKTLELGCLDFSQSNMAEWLLGLPSTITSLNLLVSTLPKDSFSAFASNYTITRLQVACLETPEDGWASCIASLPLELLTLDLRLLCSYNDLPIPIYNITDVSFKAVPASITDINIPNYPSLTKASISHLPHLTWLEIGGNRLSGST